MIRVSDDNIGGVLIFFAVVAVIFIINYAFGFGWEISRMIGIAVVLFIIASILIIKFSL